MPHTNISSPAPTTTPPFPGGAAGSASAASAAGVEGLFTPPHGLPPPDPAFGLIHRTIATTLASADPYHIPPRLRPGADSDHGWRTRHLVALRAGDPHVVRVDGPGSFIYAVADAVLTNHQLTSLIDTSGRTAAAKLRSELSPISSLTSAVTIPARDAAAAVTLADTINAIACGSSVDALATTSSPAATPGPTVIVRAFPRRNAAARARQAAEGGGRGGRGRAGDGGRGGRGPPPPTTSSATPASTTDAKPADAQPKPADASSPAHPSTESGFIPRIVTAGRRVGLIEPWGLAAQWPRHGEPIGIVLVTKLAAAADLEAWLKTHDLASARITPHNLFQACISADGAHASIDPTSARVHPLPDSVTDITAATMGTLYTTPGVSRTDAPTVNTGGRQEGRPVWGFAVWLTDDAAAAEDAPRRVRACFHPNAPVTVIPPTADPAAVSFKPASAPTVAKPLRITHDAVAKAMGRAPDPPDAEPVPSGAGAAAPPPDSVDAAALRRAGNYIAKAIYECFHIMQGADSPPRVPRPAAAADLTVPPIPQSLNQLTLSPAEATQFRELRLPAHLRLVRSAAEFRLDDSGAPHPDDWAAFARGQQDSPDVARAFWIRHKVAGHAWSAPTVDAATPAQTEDPELDYTTPLSPACPKSGLCGPTAIRAAQIPHHLDGTRAQAADSRAFSREVFSDAQGVTMDDRRYRRALRFAGMPAIVIRQGKSAGKRISCKGSAVLIAPDGFPDIPVPVLLVTSSGDHTLATGRFALPSQVHIFINSATGATTHRGSSPRVDILQGIKCRGAGDRIIGTWKTRHEAEAALRYAPPEHAAEYLVMETRERIPMFAQASSPTPPLPTALRDAAVQPPTHVPPPPPRSHTPGDQRWYVVKGGNNMPAGKRFAAVMGDSVTSVMVTNVSGANRWLLPTQRDAELSVALLEATDPRERWRLASQSPYVLHSQLLMYMRQVNTVPAPLHPTPLWAAGRACDLIVPLGEPAVRDGWQAFHERKAAEAAAATAAAASTSAADPPSPPRTPRAAGCSGRPCRGIPPASVGAGSASDRCVLCNAPDAAPAANDETLCVLGCAACPGPGHESSCRACGDAGGSHPSHAPGVTRKRSRPVARRRSHSVPSRSPSASSAHDRASRDTGRSASSVRHTATLQSAATLSSTASPPNNTIARYLGREGYSRAARVMDRLTAAAAANAGGTAARAASTARRRRIAAAAAPLTGVASASVHRTAAPVADLYAATMVRHLPVAPMPVAQSRQQLARAVLATIGRQPTPSAVAELIAAAESARAAHTVLHTLAREACAQEGAALVFHVWAMSRHLRSPLLILWPHHRPTLIGPHPPARQRRTVHAMMVSETPRADGSLELIIARGPPCGTVDSLGSYAAWVPWVATPANSQPSVARNPLPPNFQSSDSSGDDDHQATRPIVMASGSHGSGSSGSGSASDDDDSDSSSSSSSSGSASSFQIAQSAGSSALPRCRLRLRGAGRPHHGGHVPECAETFTHGQFAAATPEHIYLPNCCSILPPVTRQACLAPPPPEPASPTLPWRVGSGLFGRHNTLSKRRKTFFRAHPDGSRLPGSHRTPDTHPNSPCPRAQPAGPKPGHHRTRVGTCCTCRLPPTTHAEDPRLILS